MSASDNQRDYRLIALVVAFALFMQQLDATVLTIALPTGYNAVAFVDMSQERMSAVTSLCATFQRLSLSLGVCFATSILELSAPMAARSFSIAFVITGIVAIQATLINHRFPHDAEK